MRSTSETLRATQLTSVAPSLCKATRVDLAVAPEPKITPLEICCDPASASASTRPSTSVLNAPTSVPKTRVLIAPVSSESSSQVSA